jgi:hypothetical protein
MVVRTSGCRPVGSCLVVLILAAAVGRPVLAGDAKQEAKARFMAGQSHYNLNEYPEALNKFKEAYRIFPDPVFLYNLGQCERQLGHFEEAIRFYRSFLREQPKAPNRQDVLHKIEEMETAQKSKAAEADKALTPPLPAEGKPTKPSLEPAASQPGTESPTPKLEYPTPSSEAKAASTTTSPADDKTAPVASPDEAKAAANGVADRNPTLPTIPPVNPEAPMGFPSGVDLSASAASPTAQAEAPPFYERWWFWTAAGVVAVGAGVGMYLLTSGSGASAPSTTLGSKKVF